jgi:hypothetical protein
LERSHNKVIVRELAVGEYVNSIIFFLNYSKATYPNWGYFWDKCKIGYTKFKS